ncbi:unnamed protein product [Strongylus vulgaris]|uniref:Uncharacterized protein n=1 Tax=Strongylus vulgaris TaxID=40348 RepID=A0A3P7IRV9_STRVU|nr:unnamed protein product [Strongylus vulgaris]
MALHCFLLTLAITFNGRCRGAEDRLVFDDFIADRFEGEFEQLYEKAKKELRHKLGVLALYFRIYKKLVPVAGNDIG